jgi:hypothetical protein
VPVFVLFAALVVERPFEMFPRQEARKGLTLEEG